MQFLDNYRAGIFDLDGTIADSLAHWDNLNTVWCARRGLSAERFVAEVAPLSLEDGAALAIELFDLSDTQEELIAEWEAMCLDMYAERVQPMPGAVELLHALRERGWPLAVATATYRSGCEAFLRHHGLLEFFEELCITGEIGREKDQPDVYLAAARAMHTEPADCLVFEDLLQNARGVRAAGMGLVLVDGPGTDFAANRRAADLAVHSLVELL